jgi:hypothetical protein
MLAGTLGRIYVGVPVVVKITDVCVLKTESNPPEHAKLKT